MQIQVDENISLQPITISHADSMMDLINANRIYLRQWLPWVDNMRTIENAKANIEDCALRAAAKTDFTFVIMFNNKMAGRIGIHHVNQQNKIGEIGYWLADNMQGHGIITKSCVALISYGFQTLGLNRIEIKCATGNVKSKAVADKLKFKFEAVLIEAELVNGKFLDLYQFAMLKKDWQG